MDWNLSNSIRNWVMATTGLGPGVGDIHYLVANDSAYYAWLRDDLHQSDSKIHHSFADGEDALTASRNDCLLVYPGTYTVTAQTVWDKNLTHLIGMAGPRSRGAMGGTLINCVTTTVANVVELEGNNCQFHNVQLRNVAANAGNLAALKLTDGVNFYAKGCHFSGQGAATQVATAGNCAVWFYTDSGGKPWGATFVDCKIGDAGEVVRTAGSPLFFSGGSALTPKYIEFHNCVIEGWTQTASVATVDLSANYCIDRYLLFKDTLFYNYYVNNAGTATEVFDNGCGTTFNALLFNCMQQGHAAWNTTGLNYFYGNSATPSATGGLATALT